MMTIEIVQTFDVASTHVNHNLIQDVIQVALVKAHVTSQKLMLPTSGQDLCDRRL